MKSRFEKQNNLVHKETHLDESELIAKIWEGTAVIKSFFSNSQRGTIIILKGPFTLVASESDSEGRYCIANVTHELLPELSGNSLTLVNINAPNNHKDSLQFFDNIFNKVEQFNANIATDQLPDIVFAGDFNFVFDKDSDCQNRNISKDEVALSKFVSNKLYELELWDLVQSSKAACNFTWRRDKIRSRIDYIFASSPIAGKVSKLVNKWHLVKTDHAAVIVELASTHEIFSGRSYPKLSFNDIKDKEDKEFVRSTIIEAKNNFLSNWCPHTRLEYVKLMIRSSVLVLKAKRNKAALELDNLKADLNRLEQSPVFDNDLLVKSAELKQLIDKTEEHKEEQLRIRSGIKWREEGERSSKFFLNLISSKQRNRATQTGFIDNNGLVLSENEEIISHARSFYADLYSFKPVLENNSFFKNCPSLDDGDRTSTGDPITIAELRATLKTCKDSTPGLDGIPYSFYKIFADLLLTLVLDSWNYGLLTGTMAPSHRQSCITIIPKAGKDTRYIKNWRPITVASCDLKIITKALSIRMSKVLPKIIHHSQAAYVPGRNINFNNRILSHILKNTDNQEDIIVSFDAEKAFDSVSHVYLRKVLEKYNFPESFLTFFNLIYKSNSAVVQVNGHLSKPFDIARGVKQGDALSCSLFILAVDPLIRNIDYNTQIEPLIIDLNGKTSTVKILSYADDIAVITKSNSSVRETFKEYESLYRCSGLKLNADKTEILRLCKHETSDLLTLNDISSTYLDKTVVIKPSDTVKICGNYLTTDPKEGYAHNVTSKIASLRTLLLNWSKRNLSIYGKMLIVKCHALSQLTFVNQFQNISTSDIKQIESICYKFLWNQGPDRVKRSTIKLPKNEGGIDGIDVESFLLAAKIRQYFKAEKHCELLRFIQKNGAEYDDISKITRTYLSKVLKKNWKNVDFADLDNDEKTMLWNCNLRNFFKPGSKSDKLLVNMEATNLLELTSIGRNATNKIIRSLPKIFKYLLISDYPASAITIPLLFNGKVKTIDKLTSKNLQLILKCSLGKTFLLNTKFNLTLSDRDEKLGWFHLWRIRNPILRSVRLKVLYKDIYCQERRFRFGLTDSPLCTICGLTEDVAHQLYDCTIAKRMWQLYNNFFETNKTFEDVLIVGQSSLNEIVKSAIIKLLIQIDRSANLSIHQVHLRIIQHLTLEIRVNNNKIYQEALTKLRAIFN